MTRWKPWAILEPYTDKEVVLGVRPADIFDKNLKNPVEALPGTHFSGSTIRTLVDVSEPMGDSVTLSLMAGRHQIVATIDAETKAKEGDTFDIVLDLNKAHLFDPETEQAILPARRR